MSATNITLLEDLEVGPFVVPSGTNVSVADEWARDMADKHQTNGAAQKPTAMALLPEGADSTIGVKGVYVDRLSIVQAPYQVRQTPLIMVQTDSFGVGGAGYYSGPDPISMPRNFFGRLGADRVFTDPQGGTGFIAGGTLAYTASARTSLISTVNPDILVLFGSVNDSSATLATMTTAVSEVIDAARAVMGSSKPIIITGVMGKNSTYGEGTIESYLRQAIAAKGDAKVFFLPVQGASQPWVYAGKNASSPDGTGNADWIISPDNLHPLQIGKDYLCRLLAEATMRLAVSNR